MCHVILHSKLVTVWGQMSTNHKEDHSILTELERVTKVAPHYLTDFHPGTDDARSRLQWASMCHTTHPEDMAYSLFGVFNLHLPVLYGESKENALRHLLTEIILKSGDISVLDWVESHCHTIAVSLHTSLFTEPSPFNLHMLIKLSHQCQMTTNLCPPSRWMHCLPCFRSWTPHILLVRDLSCHASSIVSQLSTQNNGNLILQVMCMTFRQRA